MIPTERMDMCTQRKSLKSLCFNSPCSRFYNEREGRMHIVLRGYDRFIEWNKKREELRNIFTHIIFTHINLPHFLYFYYYFCNLGRPVVQKPTCSDDFCLPTEIIYPGRCA